MAGTGRTNRRSSAATVSTIEDLYRGHQRLALLRDLAMAEWSYKELGHQLNVPASEVAMFAAMHANEISEVRGALAGKLALETAGLWVAKRYNRVAEYQDQIEQLADDIDMARERYGPGSKPHIDLIRTWAIIVSKVADEYLPTRVDRTEGNHGKVVRYVIEADDELSAGLS